MPKARKKIIKREPRPELKQFLENCASQLGLTFFTLLSLNAKIRRQCIKPSNHNCAATVWPQPIWKKVRSWWQIPPQHQSAYLGGPESALIEIPHFRPFLWSKFSKIKNFKKFLSAPNFFFPLQYIKNRIKVVSLKNFFCSWKKKLVWEKLLLKFYEVRSEREDFNWCWFWAS